MIIIQWASDGDFINMFMTNKHIITNTKMVRMLSRMLMCKASPRTRREITAISMLVSFIILCMQEQETGDNVKEKNSIVL